MRVEISVFLAIISTHAVNTERIFNSPEEFIPGVFIFLSVIFSTPSETFDIRNFRECEVPQIPRYSGGEQGWKYRRGEAEQETARRLPRLAYTRTTTELARFRGVKLECIERGPFPGLIHSKYRGARVYTRTFVDI